MSGSSGHKIGKVKMGIQRFGDGILGELHLDRMSMTAAFLAEVKGVVSANVLRYHLTFTCIAQRRRVLERRITDFYTSLHGADSFSA